MEIPQRNGARPDSALPEIYIHGSRPSDGFRSIRATSNNSTSSPTAIPGPMSIPNARDPVPPPLPPPRHVSNASGDDIAWRFANSRFVSSREDDNWERSTPSVPTGSSLRGGFPGSHSSVDDRPNYTRRTSSASTITSLSGLESAQDSYQRIDEGYASLYGTSIGSNQSKYPEPPSSMCFQSSVHDKYKSNNAQAFDKFQLQKLDARGGSGNTTPPKGLSAFTFSSSASDASPTSRIALEHRIHTQLKPLSLPIMSGRPGITESPLSSWADTPLSSGVSPSNPFLRHGSQGHIDYRSPTDAADSERYSSRRPGSGSAMSIGDDISGISGRSRDPHDPRISPDHEGDFHMEEAGMRRLHIEDHSRPDSLMSGIAAGQKRRASSPPREDGPSLHRVGSASDLFRRRDSVSRTSPGPRYHSTSGSISSTASGPRSNSYASTTLSVAPSSMTSMSSFGRLSPGGISPLPADSNDLIYATSIPYSPSSGELPSRSSHIRNLSETRHLSETRPLMTSRKLSDTTLQAKLNGTSKMQGIFICECCPKKPKKFESQDELNAHEQEKQYECAYCRNRFKNKNEAERHQNSLHLRRHSWSCAALSGYAAVFHTSPNRPNDADSCGYCGEDFLRSGISSPSANAPPVAVATEQDWEVRVIHLQEMHKFGECNHAKKFFRADHFRQHLKHSHAGTSGKWTNMLENACMKDEPLPEPIRRPGLVGRINEENEEEAL